MSKKYYLIYKITNTVNNKIYIGAHSTSNKDDEYMGSGKWLNNSKNKYGIEHFKKEILFEFTSKEEMYLKESELVDEEFIIREDTYNLKLGGEGGWDYVNKLGGQGKRLNDNLSSDKRKLGNFNSNNNKEKYRQSSITLKKYYSTNQGQFKGKKHTEETKLKISEANKIHQKGKGNSQFGTIWITNDIENKKIKKYSTITEGWRKGRKIK